MRPAGYDGLFDKKVEYVPSTTLGIGLRIVSGWKACMRSVAGLGRGIKPWIRIRKANNLDASSTPTSPEINEKSACRYSEFPLLASQCPCMCRCGKFPLRSSRAVGAHRGLTPAVNHQSAFG